MPARDLAVEQDESPFAGHKMLLDGQQRLTSLSAIIRGEGVQVRGKRRPIEILFNLDHPDGPPSDVSEVETDAVMQKVLRLMMTTGSSIFSNG